MASQKIDRESIMDASKSFLVVYTNKNNYLLNYDDNPTQNLCCYTTIEISIHCLNLIKTNMRTNRLYFSLKNLDIKYDNFLIAEDRPDVIDDAPCSFQITLAEMYIRNGLQIYVLDYGEVLQGVAFANYDDTGFKISFIVKSTQKYSDYYHCFIISLRHHSNIVLLHIVFHTC
jgi:hypothetical protein